MTTAEERDYLRDMTRLLEIEFALARTRAKIAARLLEIERLAAAGPGSAGPPAADSRRGSFRVVDGGRR